MSAIVAALSGPIFGTTDELGVYMTDLSKQEVRADTELTNGQGDIAAFASTGLKYVLTGSFAVEDIATSDGYLTGEALVGATITITDTEFAGTYWVKEVTNSKSNSGFMTGSFSATKYDLALAL